MITGAFFKIGSVIRLMSTEKLDTPRLFKNIKNKLYNDKSLKVHSIICLIFFNACVCVIFYTYRICVLTIISLQFILV